MSLLRFSQVAGAPAIDPEDTHNDDLEAAPTRSDGYQPLAIENVSPRQFVSLDLRLIFRDEC